MVDHHLRATRRRRGPRSSDPWNNAGTGHSALCELNYTPAKGDGVDISKAVKRQRAVPGLPAVLGVRGRQRDPHRSQGVHQPDPARELRARRGQREVPACALRRARRPPAVRGMEYSESEEFFAERLPLMAKGRDYSDPVALNWTESGTDVDFGALTRQIWVTSAPPAARCSSGTRSATSPSSPTAAGSSRSRTCAPGPRRPSTPSSCRRRRRRRAARCSRSRGSRKPRASAASP